MKMKPFVAGAMAWVMLAIPCMQLPAMAEAPNKSDPPARVYFEASRESIGADKVYASLWSLQQTRKLSYEETMDLAMSLVLLQNWDRAAGVYQSVAGTVTDSSKKAAAICGAGQSLAAAQKWTEAARLMNEVNRLIPSSKAAAALRYAYWSNAKDGLETQAAQDRMKQLNLSGEGNVVCGPLSTIAIVAITALGVVWILVNKPSSDDLRKVAPPLYFGVIATLAAAPA